MICIVYDKGETIEALAIFCDYCFWDKQMGCL